MYYYKYSFGIIGMTSRYVLNLAISNSLAFTNWEYRHNASNGLRIA